MPKWIAFLFLVLCTFFDIRSRQLPLTVILVFGIMTAAITGIDGIWTHPAVFLKLMPGVLFLIMGLLTKQAIGYGDGVVILFLGLLLGVKLCVSVVFVGLLLCSICSVMILAMRKGSSRTKLPFVPFLLSAWGVITIVQ